MKDIYLVIAECFAKLSDAYRALADAAKTPAPVAEAPASGEEATAPVKEITIEDVRAVLVAKSDEGKRKEVKALLLKYDSGKLSGVKKSDYPALLAEAEAL